MSKSPSSATRKRREKARDCCQQIVIWMAPTEKTRRRDDVAVMIGADLWKRIYLQAKRGAK